MAYTYDPTASPMSAKDRVRLYVKDNAGVAGDASTYVFDDAELTQILADCDSNVLLAAAIACRIRAAKEAGKRTGVRLGAYSDSTGGTTDWDALADKYERMAYERVGASGSETVEMASDDFAYQELEVNKANRGEDD